MPFKTWVVGEEVLAADFNSYVQRQVVPTFSNAAARDAAITAPSEGMMCYLTDVHKYYTHTGTAWRDLVVAGKISGGITTSLPANSEATVAMDTLEKSSGGVVRSGNNLVVPVAGLYLIAGSIPTINGSGNAIYSGSLVATLWSSSQMLGRNVSTWSGVYGAVSFAAVASLVASDIVRLAAYSNVQAFIDPNGGWTGRPSVSAMLITT